MSKTTPRKPVELRYEDLVAQKDLSAEIEEAFGEHGLGLLTVSGVPGLDEKRRALLPLAQRFASLPPSITQKYEHAASFYSFGWSHGKETLQHGRPDLLKGSFYANPLHDAPSSDQALIEQYPAFLHPNIWPSEELPELEPAFKALGRLIVEVGVLVARQCDQYVAARCPGYRDNDDAAAAAVAGGGGGGGGGVTGGGNGGGKLERAVRESKVCKGRLLHYFPYVEKEEKKKEEGKKEGGAEEKDFSTWCGWHNDHGSLTGLTPAMYLDGEGKEVDMNTLTNSSSSSNNTEEEEEEEGGLYALSRAGEVVKVLIPPHQLAFQIGETAQCHSGGLLRATPHAVKGSTSKASKGISRETFAVFMEPEMDEPMTMPVGRTVEDVCANQTMLSSSGKGEGRERGGGEGGGGLGVGVPSLESRWDPSMTFAEFTARTLKSYY